MDSMRMHNKILTIQSDCFDSQGKQQRARSKYLSFKCLLDEYIYQKPIIEQRNYNCLILI